MRLRTRGLPIHLMVLSTVLMTPLSSVYPTSAAAGSGGAVSGQSVSSVVAHAAAGLRSRLVPGRNNVTPAAAPALRARLTAAYGRLPLTFEMNEGQTDKQVQFVARTGGATVFLTATGVVLSVAQPQPSVSRQMPVASGARPHALSSERLSHLDGLPSDAHARPQPLKFSAVRLRFVGANPHPRVIGLDKQPGIVNYFIGNDRRKWRTNIATYARVEYKDVYPGVNLIYYGHLGRLEYDWQVQPGADPRAIALTVQGTQRLHLDAQGNLVLQTASSSVEQILPMVYQQISGHQRVIAAHYVLSGTDRVSIAVGAYTKNAPLIIDPVLSYSTYLGGSDLEQASGIAVDQADNAYITGNTSNGSFPTTPGAYSTTPTSTTDAFVAKMNATGTALIYSTFLGGSAYDSGNGIAVDSAGNACVTGSTTSPDFPTANAVQQSPTGTYAAFVTKLNAAGNSLVYSTYLGGSSSAAYSVGDDSGNAIAVDGAGNAFITGQTESSTFPTVNALYPHLHGGLSSLNDAFVTELTPAGRFVYSTYLGGDEDDRGFGIAVDSNDNAYITGATISGDFPLANAAQTTNGYADTAFVTKLNSSDTALIYSTYLGGTGSGAGGNDEGHGIAVDALGNAYVTGYTDSSNFPVVNALQPQNASPGDYDAFVTKFTPSGSIVYSTYLGGSSTDKAYGIAIDSTGDAFVTGLTYSPDFSTVNALPGNNAGSSDDAFVTKLNTNGSALDYSTYLGGSSYDEAYGIAVDQAGKAFVTGYTYSPDFPVVGALQSDLGGGSDAFLAKISSYTGPNRAEIGSLSEKDTTCSLAQTVSCATGDFWHTFDDLSVPGRGVPLQFTRTYNSVIANQDGPLGYGWTDNYNMFLTQDSSGNVGVNEEGGTTVVFSQTAPGVYQAPSRVLATLVTNGDGTLTFARQDQIKYTFTAPTTTTAGQLIKETDRNGYVTALTYGGGRLAAVTDPAGRSLLFSYTPAGRIASVTDPAGRSVDFIYDPNGTGNLAGVVDVGGGQTTFSYGAGTHLLQTMIDPNGGQLTNTYDASGRVVSQVDPMGRTTAFGYTPDGTTIITDTLGNVTVAHYENNVLLSETKGYGTAQAATWTYSYDPATLGVTSETDPDGHTARNTWDARGNLLSHTDALGRATRYQYDALNDTTAIIDPLGVTTVMTYDANGNLLSESRPLTQTGQSAITTLSYDPAHAGDVIARTDPDGHTSHYSYDTYGDLTQANDPQGNTTTTQYDLIGRVISVVSPNGNAAGANPISYTTAMTENAFGQTTAITDPLGHVTTYQYDPDQNLRVVTDANNHTTRYGYDLDNERTSVTRPDGSAILTGYDGDGNVITTTDALSRTTQYQYDPLNRLIVVTDPMKRVSAYAYDGAGNVITSTDPLGHATGFGYDGANELTSMTRPDGAILSRGYDLDGRVITDTSGLGHVTSYSFDSLGRLIAVTDPLSRTTSYGYDLAGNRTSMTDPLTRTTTYQYDLADEPITTTRADGSVLLTGYDADGNPISQTDPRGDVTRSSYDALDQILSVTDPLSGTTSYRYNPAGNRTAMTDPLGHTTTYQYDAMDRVITITDPLARTTSYAYDLMGNRTAVTDALTHTTGYQYDGDDEVTQITRPDGTVQSTGYDAAGNVITQTDALGHSTTYGYDALDRVITATDPLARTTLYAYDRDGNRTGLTDPLNRTTTYSYDAADQLTNVAYSDGTTPNVAYTYTPSGQRASMSDGRGTSSYQYDPLDRIITSTNGAGQAVGYRYDLAGNPTTLIYPDSSVITRTYDAANRLTGFTDWLGHSSTFSYDAANRLITATLPTTATTTIAYGYDAADELTSLVDSSNGTPYWSFGYSYDASGRVSSTHDPVTGQHSYSQDTRSRLSGDQDSTSPFTSAIGWAYDPAQDLITETYTDTTQAVSDTLGYDAAGALHSLHAISGTTPTHSYVYTTTATGDRASVSDALTGGQASYGYDQADRLITLTEALTSSAPVTTATYSYDGDGLRQSKTVNGSAEAYTWDTAEGLPQLLQDGGTRYLDGPDGLPIEQIGITGTVLYYLHDQIGSTRALLSDAGQGVATYTYSPYGSLELHTGNATTPFGFAGQYTDAESGFQYLQARYYDPATAQFLTRDPLTDLTAQPYAYVGDDPLNARDPSGRCPWCVIAVGALVGGIIGGGIPLVTDLVQHRAIDWHAVAVGALSGGVAGATFGLAAPTIGGVAGAAGVEGVAAGATTGATAGALTGVAGTATTYALDPAARQAGVGGLAQGAALGALGGVGGYAVDGAVVGIAGALRGIDVSGLRTAVGRGARAYWGDIRDPGPLGIVYRVRRPQPGQLSLFPDELQSTSESSPAAATPGETSVVNQSGPSSRAADSVWNLGYKERGLAIQDSILGRPANIPVSNYPVLDDFEDGVATSIKSLDLTDSTYQQPWRITDVLMKNAKELSQFQGRQWGEVDGEPYGITAEQIKARVLLIAFEDGVATPGQLRAIQNFFFKVRRYDNITVDHAFIP